MRAKSQPYPTDSSRWQAVLDRDPAADGHFLYAVRTTRIYCRPTCPSKRAKREHVAFYVSFQRRPSRRLPRLLPLSSRRGRSPPAARRAGADTLLETTQPEPSLRELAETAGLSPSHLQRTFKRATGLSPKQYAVARREARFKEELREDKGVTTAMYDAGYGSSRALYADAPKGLGMKPKTYQKGGEGERISFGLFDSSLGRMLIAATPKGIVALRFGEDDALLAELRGEFPAAILEEDPESLSQYQRAVEEYLSGAAQALELPLNLEATEFQTRVWQALREVPYGETRSYAELARMIGQPTAVRAVARALATNPVALVIPCHRIVRASGELSGYRWGTERKEALIAQEQRGKLG